MNADEETGGTGTAMALDEGKMGRRDGAAPDDDLADDDSGGESFGGGGFGVASGSSGSVRTGHYGTIGHGAGTGTGYGVGSGRGGGGRASIAANPTVPSGPAPLTGELATIADLLKAKNLPAALTRNGE